MPSLSPLPPPMAVEAHHLHLFSSQLLMDRELSKAEEAHPAMLGNAQMVQMMPPAATGEIMTQLYSSGIASAAPSESGLTFAGTTGAVGKKRPREHLSFLSEDFTAHFQQQTLDLDRILVHHTARMRAELGERRKRFSRQLAAAMEDGLRKRLIEKDEEIERVKNMNWALEERIRRLFVENQIWQELAQNNEATANLLRTNLEQLLAAQIRIKEDQQQCHDAAADDAESCCCGDNDDRDAASMPPPPPPPQRACRGCLEREPTVLLLPCRHLCLCAACGPATNSCPICYCSKSGSVNVNLS